MQKRDNFFSDNADLNFFVDNRIDYPTLFSLVSNEDKEALGVVDVNQYAQTIKDVLNQLGEIAGSVIAPNQKRVSVEDVVLKDGEVKFTETMRSNLDALIAAGIPALGISPKYGGLPTPLISELNIVEMLYRACPSTFLNVTWFSPIARVIEEFGSAEQKARVLPRIATGEWDGNMALTEPGAGSDLGAIQTYGVPTANGRYQLYGAKRFITNGCGHVSLVLAKRTKGAKGLQELNLYMCFRRKNDGTRNYEVTKIEDKVGLHGSATCEVLYDGSDAELIGQDGKGFDYMLHLMNEARLGVAFQGLGIMEAVLRIAKQYTNDRETWGRPISHHEMVCEKLLDLEVSTQGLRSLCFQAANALSIVQMAAHRLRDEADLSAEEKLRVADISKKYTRRLRRWTPLVKYYAGEKAFYNARECMQLHGGYGFTKEYLPEWWLRESLIIPVYEGTSQIQALMCLKDSMKEIIRKPTAFIESSLGIRVQNVREKNPLRRKLNILRQQYNSALMVIIFRLVKENVRAGLSHVEPSDIRKVLKILTKELVKFENLRPALLHAERITELKVLVCIGESLMRDVKVESSRSWLAERWLNKAIPRAACLKSEIDIDDPVLAERLGKIPIASMIG